MPLRGPGNSTHGEHESGRVLAETSSLVTGEEVYCYTGDACGTWHGELPLLDIWGMGCYVAVILSGSTYLGGVRIILAAECNNVVRCGLDIVSAFALRGFY